MYRLDGLSGKHHRPSSLLSFYQPIGDGRDGYISYNNAGTIKPKVHVTDKASKMQFGRSPSRNQTPIPSRTYKYQPDGSGRDCFVSFDAGGQLKNTVEQAAARLKFMSTLREYPDDPLVKRWMSPVVKRKQLERHRRFNTNNPEELSLPKITQYRHLKRTVNNYFT